MAVKRRTVWFSDEEWLILNARAKERDTSISAYIRDALVDDAPTSTIRGAMGMSQAERDAVLRKVNKGS